MSEPIHADINVPFPEAKTLQLRLGLAATRLTLQPGNGEAWVTGVYDDPDGTMPLSVKQEGGTVRITQHENLHGILRVVDRLVPMELALGSARPFSLALDAGGYEGCADLGGLPLTRLDVKHGAARQEILFTAPNPQPMETFNIRAGSADLVLQRLANANFAGLNVESAEGRCLFDFGGALRRPAQVKITCTKGSVEIRVPAATAARINLQTLSGEVEVGEGFTGKPGGFWTQAAVAGQTPVLTIRADVIMGEIRLATY